MFFSEETQIKKAINGNPNAWESLVKKHEKRVFNTSLRLTGNREDAMDLTQEVFFEVYRKLSQFRQQSSLATWIQKISYGKSIDFLRRSKPESQLEEETLIENETPHTHLMKSEKNQAIQSFFRSLPIEPRLILELKFFHGKTFDEIGEELGCPANTVKSKFYSAIRKHKSKMEAIHVM